MSRARCRDVGGPAMATTHPLSRSTPSTPYRAPATLSAMATPRHMLVDDQHACDYHLASRCVRRAWLCGRDKRSGKDYSHRRQWLVDRLLMLARCFAVEIYAYAVMSNHFHIVLHYDPNACQTWSDEEVARRWIEAFPPKPGGDEPEATAAAARALLLSDPARLIRARRTLGSLSHFMKHLKQPIARRANKEDGCDGHFFEQRFYSGALLNEQAMLAAMAYVDLNPVRARLARRLEQCRDVSVRARLRENSAAALAAYLRPLASGLARPTPPRLGVTLADYLDLLREMAAASDGRAVQPDDRIARWIARTATLRKRQRAYGPIESLRQWTDQRGFQLREVPLPN